jgi:tetratricopeptide (TPR) repeat protein
MKRIARTSARTTSLALLALVLPLSSRPASGATQASTAPGPGKSDRPSPQHETRSVLFNRGLERYVDGDYAGAVEHWNSLVLKDPGNRRIIEYIDRAYTNYNKAHDLFLQALDAERKRDFERCTDLVESSMRISPLLRFPVFDDYGQRRFETAQNMLDRVAREHSSSKDKVEDRIERGRKAMEKEEFEEAQAELEVALRLAPDKPTRERVGSLLADVEQKAKTKRDAERVRAHLAKAQGYYKARNLARAEEEYRTVLSIDAQNEIALRRLDRIQKARDARRDKEKRSAAAVRVGKAKVLIVKAKHLRDEQGSEFAVDEKSYKDFLKKLSDAGAHLQWAVEADPENKEARSLSTLVLRMREETMRRVEQESELLSLLGEASELGKAGRWEEASTKLKTVVLLDPDPKSERHRLAKKVLAEYEKRIAAREQEKARKNRDKARDDIGKAREYSAQGKFRSALAAISTAIRLDPDNEEAWKLQYEIGSAMTERGGEDLDSPLRRLSVMLEAQGDSARQQKNLALAADLYSTAMEWKNDEGLRGKYNAVARQRQGTTAPARNNLRLARAYLDQGRFLEARREIDRARSISPNDPAVRQAARDLETAQSRRQAAAAGTDVPRLVAEAESSYRNGAYERTREVCMRVLEADPDHVQARILERKASLKLGAATGGTMGASAGLSPEQQVLVNQHFYMGTRYYIAGNIDQAMEEWNAVLRIDGEHLKAKHNLEKCRSKLALTRATE